MLLVVPMISTSYHRSARCSLGRIVGLGVFLCLSFSVHLAAVSAAEPNLLLNGDLSAGSADAPQHWTMTPGALPRSFRWSHTQGAPAALEVATVRGYLRNIYWSQTVNLAQPGWYHLRAEVKTENSGTEAAIKIRGAHATAVTTQANDQWKPIEVYFKVADPEAVQIGCGVRATLTGRAFFRDLALSRMFRQK